MDTPIGRVDPREPAVAAVIAGHLAELAPTAPAESRHAYTAPGLAAADIDFYAAGEPGRPVALGALHYFAPGFAELKSMHTVPGYRGRGLGRCMLAHLLGVARGRGVREVLLETGTHGQFAAARAMYAAAGFEPCAPFGGYREDPHSVHLRLVLAPAGTAANR